LRISDGAPLLPPRVIPLGDLDAEELAFEETASALEIPPAISPLRRRLLLTRLVQAFRSDLRADHAARLAGELAQLLDQIETEGLDFANLAALVPDKFSEHWQLTLEFLKIVTEQWPKILTERGLIDPAERRNRVLMAQAELWRHNPPAYPVIAAGSTGSIPATAELLAVVAALPQGAVVLPGLDIHLENKAWNALDPTHPQYGMAHLLERLSIDRSAVKEWSGENRAPIGRAHLISEAMRPAFACEAWREKAPMIPPTALSGLTLIEAPGPREEALAIAIALRGALEKPDETAALVTPDRDLAARVAAELRRWGIEIDDSAGRPVGQSPPGVIFRLIAQAANEDFAPIPLLALLKHPLSLGEFEPGILRARARELELAVLRGPRPALGLAALRAILPSGHDELAAWLCKLEKAAFPLVTMLHGDKTSLKELLAAHLALAEFLCPPESLWRGEAGEALAGFLGELAEVAEELPEISGQAYPALLDTLMAGLAVRPAWGGHPRLHIWGPLEARLQQPDFVVLGGLNEGSWPIMPEVGMWMSRPMRQDFGLPLPERRIGLSAHDFTQGLSAPKVLLTRAARIQGAPSVASRWLSRLKAVLIAGDLIERFAGQSIWDNPEWLNLVEAIDTPNARRQPRPPAPTPPVASRPRALSVTEIETWMRDPYSIYAKHILGLKYLDPIDEDPGAADYGSLVHKALERFIKTYPKALPADPLAKLISIGEEEFCSVADRPGLMAFWWPRFLSIAEWFIGLETSRRSEILHSNAEVKGELKLDAPAGEFCLRCRADRVDIRRDGGIEIIDYKTGNAPSEKEVRAGFSPQLPLEAAIALHGGMADLAPTAISSLRYWKLKGGQEEGGKESVFNTDVEEMAGTALAGLKGLVAAFDRPDTPYEARPRPDKAPRYSDYEHLARIAEWQAGEDGEE
jgi:ATP-dependent helicase/nuclease subunit B